MGVYVKQNGSECAFKNSDSWIILNPLEQTIKQKINTYGVPLKEWKININRGVLTGYNEAFIISGAKRDELIKEDPKSAEIIRPILRGRDIKRYGYSDSDLFLIYVPWHFPLTYDKSIIGASKKAEILFKETYPAIYNHLLRYKEPLSKRNVAETGIRYEWYALQRYGAQYSDDFSMRKIAWSRLTRISKEDFSSFPRFAVLPENYYVMDSLCFFTGDNLDTLVKMLNSKFAAYYFFMNVAILDSGGMQMRQQFVEDIPLPHINLKDVKDESEIDETIFNAFSFTSEEIQYINDYLESKRIEICGAIRS